MNIFAKNNSSKMIRKIAHISDPHLRKSPIRNDEYEKVFDSLYKSLINEKPDRIAIVGDLVHDYLDLQGEQLIMANNFLKRLSEIAPVRITRGNHDCKKAYLKRVDSIKAIVSTLHDSNIIYYDKTGFYSDDNVVWAVWHHGEHKNNPWNTKQGKEILKNHDESKRYIDLFHDPVNGCKSDSGVEMNSSKYYKISEFLGDFSFFGDIHTQQFLDKKKTKGYSSSLIAQNFGEGDDNFHGYLLWDVINADVKKMPIHNDYSFKNVVISQYVDFDDLDFEIENPTKCMKVRFIWKTLPQTRTKDSVRKLCEYVVNKYGEVTISHKNEFIENDKIVVDNTVTLENISTKSVQQEIFKEYLTKIGVDDKLINDVISLDDEITNNIDAADDGNIEWSVVKFGGKNFMSYEDFYIDWRDIDGLYQIVGQNVAGKTTIFKILSYLQFGKTLETESRIKFGDIRYINNRNNANFCEGFLVLEANGEYYGIKRRTEINRNKTGDINNVSTQLNYYLLQSPDDELTSDKSIDVLDEIRRQRTQKKIESIIGNYDNFNRIVLTTSDTLNKILSNDMATFTDSLLFDSGLDIFDKKLESHKIYQKKINEMPRVVCNIETTNAETLKHSADIEILKNEIINIEKYVLPKLHKDIDGFRLNIEDLTKKFYKIDNDIFNLNVNATNLEVKKNNELIDSYRKRESYLIDSIAMLKSEYNVNELNRLNELKEEHKSNEYKHRLKIKEHEQNIRDFVHKIEIVNGEIFRLKESGTRLKNEIHSLKESKTCPTCGQLMSNDHINHVNEIIESKKSDMFKIADEIKIKENVDKQDYNSSIEIQKNAIKSIQNEIEASSNEMELVLVKIGEITNDKNDYEKRKELQIELNTIPMLIQNIELKRDALLLKIDNHQNSLLQIEDNKSIQKSIDEYKVKINELEYDKTNLNEVLFNKKSNVTDKINKIQLNNQLVAKFIEQEYRDRVSSLYKSCVHRDGIPKQMLSNYVIPKINAVLESILSVASFKVWLDIDDLRPKLMYYNRPTAVIDCISASGKERTFASIVLKFGLNQINVKSKPTMFLLDEVMGKLDDNGVEEFIEILQLIKNYMKKVVIIEHHANINPDYVISVTSNESGISSLILE